MISPVGGTQKAQSGVGSLTVFYIPTPGNPVIFFVASTHATITVKDNLGNSAIAGPSISVTGITSGYQSFYILSSAAGVTSYTVTLGGIGAGSVVLEEYSGNTGGLNPSLAGNATSGTVSPATLTVSIDDANDFVVVGFVSVGQTFTGTVGNTRQSQAAVTFPQILMDNTAVSTGASVTCTATLTAAAWGGLAIELRLTPSSIPVALDDGYGISFGSVMSGNAVTTKF